MRRGAEFLALCPPDDDVARRVLHDYGAMFLGAKNILPPPLCVFSSEDEVSQFQGLRVGRHKSLVMSEDSQPAAMFAL
jgi:hypothetical protein